MTQSAGYDALRAALEEACRPVPPRPPSGAPLLTVSMPARNAADFVADALRSVLGQRGIDLEAIVVDDASDDDTAGVVEGLGDPRVRLYRNARQRGIGACHNLVVEHARAPYIAHVDADDVALPGSLAALVAPLEADPSVAQTYCDFHEIDRGGGIDPAEYRAQADRFLRRARPDVDYRRELLVHGMVVNHLRTYRRSAILEVGGFDETLRHGEDWAMAVALADRWEVRRVPGFHYCRRVHGGNVSLDLRFRGLRYWRGHLRSARRLLAERDGELLGRGRGAVLGLMLLGLLHSTGTVVGLKRLARLGRGG